MLVQMIQHYKNNVLVQVECNFSGLLFTHCPKCPGVWWVFKYTSAILKKKSWVSLVKEDIKSEDLKIYSWSLCDIWHKDVWIHKCVWKYLYIHIFVYVHTFACMSGCWAVPTWVNVWGCLCVQLWGTSLLAQVVQLSHWTVRLVCCVFKVSLSLLVLVLQSLTISV